MDLYAKVESLTIEQIQQVMDRLDDLITKNPVKLREVMYKYHLHRKTLIDMGLAYFALNGEEYTTLQDLETCMKRYTNGPDGKTPAEKEAAALEVLDLEALARLV